MMRTLWTAVAALALGAGALAAQDAEDVILEQRSMSGPRLGLTFVAGARA